MSHSQQSDDVVSFLAELGDVQPLLPDDKVFLQGSSDSLAKKLKRQRLSSEHQSILNPLTMEGVKPVKPDDFLAHKDPGIQDGVYKNLRLGKYPIEQRISLLNCSLVEARNTLYDTLVASHEQGIRVVLIQHGWGLYSKPFPGLKKSYVNHWLPQMGIVIAYHSAKASHGGLGATYVLLKKHPEQKLINREKQRRKQASA
jgi:DNA-nicking Smr family endonuclease